MSYILDALRRADRERRRNAGDPTADVVALGAPQSPGTHRLLILLAVIGIAIVGLLGANLALRLGGGHGGEAAPTAAAVPAPPPAAVPKLATTPAPQAAPVLVPAGTPAAAETATEASAIDTGAPLETLDQLTPAPPAVRATPQRARPTTSRPGSGIVTAAAPVAAIGRPRAVAAPKPPAPAVGGNAVTRIARLSAEDRAKLPTAASPTSPAADLKLMPDDFRASFPQIDVQVHVYNPDATKRWAMIDGNRYREGDTLPDGLRIEQIVPQGIVFDWRGREVLYPS